jgi:hypothetical protein
VDALLDASSDPTACRCTVCGFESRVQADFAKHPLFPSDKSDDEEKRKRKEKKGEVKKYSACFDDGTNCRFFFFCIEGVAVCAEDCLPRLRAVMAAAGDPDEWTPCAWCGASDEPTLPCTVDDCSRMICPFCRPLCVEENLARLEMAFASFRQLGSSAAGTTAGASAPKLTSQQAQRLEQQRHDELGKQLRATLHTMFDSSESDSDANPGDSLQTFALNPLRRAETERAVSVPALLASRLKPHQEEGLRFMWNNCFGVLSVSKTNPKKKKKKEERKKKQRKNE